MESFDRDLTQHLDHRYGWNPTAQEESEARISQAMEFSRRLENEPALEVMATLREKFQLSSDELAEVIHRWVVS